MADDTPLTPENIPEGYRNIPLQALRRESRRQLCLHLNLPIPVFGNDYEVLAERFGCDHLEIMNFGLLKNPTEEVLLFGIRRNVSMYDFLKILTQMERLDIFSACEPLIRRDVEMWKPVQDPKVSSEDAEAPLTVGQSETGKREYFDAFVSCNPQDDWFLQKLINKLEVEMGFKLCIPARDIIVGVSYSTAAAELIEIRCKRAIIVISSSYGGSEEERGIQEWQLQFAQAISPVADKNTHKLIPIRIDKSAKTPSILRPYNISDYSREATQEWFWKRLEASLAALTNNAGGYEGPKGRLGRPLLQTRQRAFTEPTNAPGEGPSTGEGRRQRAYTTDPPTSESDGTSLTSMGPSSTFYVSLSESAESMSEQ